MKVVGKASCRAWSNVVVTFAVIVIGAGIPAGEGTKWFRGVYGAVMEPCDKSSTFGKARAASCLS